MSKKQIRIGRKELLRALEPIATIQKGKSTMPAFTQVRLEIADDVVKVTGFGPMASYQTSFDAVDGALTFSTALDTSKLTCALQALTTNEVTIEPKEASLVLVGNVKNTIHTIEDDLPKFAADIETSEQCEFAMLLKAMKRIDPSVSDDFTRPHVNSVLLRNGRAAATDGHRLAVVDTDDCIKDLDILVPSDCGAALTRMAGDVAPGAKVEIGFNEKKTKGMFRVGRQTLVHNLCDSAFPPYEQVIPKGDSPCVARVPRSTLAESVVSFIRASRGDAKMGVRVSVSDDRLSFITSESGVDRVTVDGHVDAVTAGTLEKVGVNAQYLLDALNMFDSDHVDIELRGELDPLVIKSGAKDDRDIAVVMPMRV